MKKVLLFFALLLSFTILAQGPRAPKDKFDIDWGTEFKAHKRSSASRIIGKDNDYTYVLKTGKNYSIDKVDRNMRMVNNVEIELSYEKYDFSFENIFMFNKKLFLVVSNLDKKLKRNNLYYIILNTDDLQPEGDVTKISELSYEGNSKRNSGNFGFKVSKDESKLLVFYNLPYDKGENEKFGFHVFDTNFNEVWSRNIELPYIEELFDITHYDISNTGDLFMLGKLYKDKAKDSRKGKPNYEYRLISYRQEQEDRLEYKIALPGIFLVEMNVIPLDNGDFQCVGFYSEKGTYSVKGCYVLKVDGITSDIVSSNTYEFSIDFITQNMTAKKAAKTKKKKAKGKAVEMYEYSIDNIVVKEDGSIVMVGEQYYMYVTTTYSTNANGGSTSSTTYHYVYGDILVISISAEEEIEWAQKIPKMQHSTNDGGFYSSYYFHTLDNKMYFVYNDHRDNLKLVRSGKVKGFTKAKKTSITVAVSMDYDGNAQKTRLFSYDQTGTLVRPKVCDQIDAESFLLYAQKKKKHQYAKVEIK